jgi:hypothetical protein
MVNAHSGDERSDGLGRGFPLGTHAPPSGWLVSGNKCSNTRCHSRPAPTFGELVQVALYR